MRERIVLLYDNAGGKALCDVASRVLTQVAVAFGHTLILPVIACPPDQEEASDALLDACAQAKGVLCGNEKLRCLPSLADEMLCAYRARELRYAHLCENRALMGRQNDLRAIVVQALSAEPGALQSAARQAFMLSAREELPIVHVPPAGRMAQDWREAVTKADSLSAPFHAREVALPEVVPLMIRTPTRVGVALCPPYAGSVIAPAAAALCGAPGMCFDYYGGGERDLYAALDGEGDGEERNPFGMLRASHRLLRDTLRLQREADCLEAAIRNVLQAGWRTADIFSPSARGINAAGIAGLICQQLEVAGEWIAKQ